MNFSVLNSILRHRHLAEHPTIKHILTVLATHAAAPKTPNTGQCYLKLETMMEETSRSRRCVEDTLARAEAAGFVKVLKQSGRGLSATWTFLLHPDRGQAIPTVAELARRPRVYMPAASVDEVSPRSKLARPARFIQQGVPESRQGVPDIWQGVPESRQGLPGFRSVYKDKVPNEVLDELSIEAARATATTASPSSLPSSSSTPPAPTAPLGPPRATANTATAPATAQATTATKQSPLEPSPFEDAALNELATICGVNRCFPSLLDRQNWPAAAASLAEALEISGLPRSQAGTLLQRFRAGWFQPEPTSGHSRPALYLSQIVFYLLPWVQATLATAPAATLPAPASTPASTSTPTTENPTENAHGNSFADSHPALRPAPLRPGGSSPRYGTSPARGMAPVSKFAPGVVVRPGPGQLRARARAAAAAASAAATAAP